MGNLFLIFSMATLIGVGATWAVRRVALRMGLVDRPGLRKIHVTPVPLLGGVALYVASVFSLLLLVEQYYVMQAVSLLVGASAMALLGLWDDRQPLTPAVKFAVQLLITAGLVLSGVQVELFHAPWLNVLVTGCWVLYVTNAFNLIDNMDGLATGIAAVAAAFFMLCAVLNGQVLVGSLAAAMLGACLGFLVFNFNPARIFMGDAGSLFLGFMLAALAIKLRFPGNTDRVTWMVPVLLLGIPIFDTAFVVVSRLRRGVPVWQGGKDHVSHSLAARGWSTRRVVLVLYAAAAVLGGLGVALSTLSLLPAYGVFGTVLLLALFVGLKVRGVLNVLAK